MCRKEQVLGCFVESEAKRKPRALVKASYLLARGKFTHNYQVSSMHRRRKQSPSFVDRCTTMVIAVLKGVLGW